ncbi:hypothetical protein QVD17_42002 [Tagetes erecta]|uniref:Protein kinase domain-containing protein n=1 Tax=Tagetes erecta TaxID=13708 RepID=A0AAD8JLE4_TARER|nr:hypothetical protein QVD17_42002 [Tagetes erecta]
MVAYNSNQILYMSSASEEGGKLSSSSSCQRFSLAEIQAATKDFDEELVIGEGGFGKVYKGQIFGEGVAIKRLSSVSNQGEHEFRAEIKTLSKLRHCHLVSLIGYCDDNKEMILVYEYVPNGTLYYHLHKAITYLNWVQRMRIAVGAGRGLDYLHTGVGTREGIIHRDVKSSNILLDENMEAMISDFGLSKMGPISQSSLWVGASASIKGTFGYLDPEYFYTNKISTKSDVYAFGVVLFELLTGRLAIDERNLDDEYSLVRWAQRHVKERKLDEIVDSKIKGTIFPKCLRQFAQIAYRCVHSNPKDRPTITEVVASLQAIHELQLKSSYSAKSSKIMGLTRIYKYVTNMQYSGAIWNVSNQEEAIELPLISFSTIAKATANFAPNNILGRGSFGNVYKGVLEEGKLVAVKRLSKDSRQGLNEFKNEIICLSKLQHQNIVKLLGHCIHGDEKLLIYEYMSNKGLNLFIFGNAQNMFLNWSTRFKIIKGIARGLVYMHQDSLLRVIHRDIKPNNILLDEDMNPKISDFGIARRFEGQEGQEHISTRVAGTIGYLAPEYALRGHLSVKSDVYSFGVLVMEIVSGRKTYRPSASHGNKYLIEHAWNLYDESRLMDLIDATLAESCNPLEVTRSIEVALLCIQGNTGDRPNMSSVIMMLNDECLLPQPKKPGYLAKEFSFTANSSVSTSPTYTINGLTITEVEAQ